MTTHTFLPLQRNLITNNTKDNWLWNVFFSWFPWKFEHGVDFFVVQYRIGFLHISMASHLYSVWNTSKFVAKNTWNNISWSPEAWTKLRVFFYWWPSLVVAEFQILFKLALCSWKFPRNGIISRMSFSVSKIHQFNFSSCRVLGYFDLTRQSQKFPPNVGYKVVIVWESSPSG